MNGWLDVNSDEAKELMKTDKTLEVRFDNGDILPYDDEEWPFACVTDVREIIK